MRETPKTCRRVIQNDSAAGGPGMSGQKEDRGIAIFRRISAKNSDDS